jgi:sodium-dependent dicarboxylate transporter 2/3/5
MSLCIKIGITSLVPLILIPLLGIDSGSSIATSYFEDSIVTCFGSLLISDAVEYYNLHRKFANIFLLRANKYGFNGILASFLFCSGFLSMFLSNTATAALMTPLARAIVNEIKLSKISPEEINQITNLAKAIDISIAFAATVGGQATITGTGANLVLKGLMLGNNINSDTNSNTHSNFYAQNNLEKKEKLTISHGYQSHFLYQL